MVLDPPGRLPGHEKGADEVDVDDPAELLERLLGHPAYRDDARRVHHIGQGFAAGRLVEGRPHRGFVAHVAGEDTGTRHDIDAYARSAVALELPADGSADPATRTGDQRAPSLEKCVLRHGLGLPVQPDSVAHACPGVSR